MNKVALFGGTFDPIHQGHRACIQHLVEKMEFSKVVLIPTSQNPLKMESVPASKKDRLKMIDLALRGELKKVEVDQSEIMQRPPSYSCHTLERYQKHYQPEQLHMVMGLDTFSGFDQWKNFEAIIKMTNLLVVTRPPHSQPAQAEDFPELLKPHIQNYDEKQALLSSGRSLEFVTIQTKDISSRDIRQKLKNGEPWGHLVDKAVEDYILEHQIYKTV